MTKRCTLVLAALTALWIALPGELQADYLGKSAAQWLAEFTAGKDVQSRRSAAFALGKLGQEALPAVQDLMRCALNDSEDASLRETAVYSVGQIVPRGRGGEEVARLLCRLVSARVDERIKRSALVALGSFGSDAAEIRTALETALNDDSPAVRQNAIWALGEVCQKTNNLPTSSLRKALQDRSGDKLVKRDAALALAKILTHQVPGGDDESQQRERERRAKVCEQARAVLDDLLDCVGQDYVELKKAACATLINLVNADDAKAVPVLAKACKDGDIDVRRNAAIALAEIGGPAAEAAVPVLRHEISSTDSEVRVKTVLAFRKLGSVGGKALPELLKALATDPEPRVRFNTAVTLGEWKVDAEQVVPALVQRVIDPKEALEVRVTAAVSLKDIGPCEQAVLAIPSLVKVLNNPGQPPQVRERVLWALIVHKGDLLRFEEAFDAMKKVLSEEALRNPASNGKMLRYNSAYLLGVFKKSAAPKEVFPALLDFLKDPKVLIFKDRTAKGGTFVEGGGGKTVVAETGSEDGRIMAVQALKEIGAKDVRQQEEIIQQLLQLRDPPVADSKVHDAVVQLLKECGK